VFDHVAIRASELPASERFYRTVLGALGIEPDRASDRLVRWQEFILAAANEERPPTRRVHIGFVAPTRAGVDAFWRAGTEAGYADDGPPADRPQYRPDYYGAFLRDPDGNSVEAVHHGDTRRGGHIDHLWIGVRELAAAEAFYETIARDTGLRPGRRWDDGVQFRGAWATFSLLADGREPTENLHIAFPAPDRATVEQFHATALAAGFQSNGEPGERPQYHPGYYAAFVLDPDGTNVESVVHERG
jgi:catechol 2,3-dioxygenase-like lactoylglutathione lyase family enzyme